MKFDLALDPSRDVLRLAHGRASGRHGRPDDPRAGLPAGGPLQRTARQAAAGLPVLHAVVAPESLARVLQNEAVRAPAAHRETLFQATLACEDTLVVPPGAQVIGNLEAANVHVQGAVHGTVRATRGCLVVDRGATVHGRVQGAGTVVIAGRVCATTGAGGAGVAVVAHGKLRLARSARVEGVVHYAEIDIYEGALVAGPLLALEPA